MFKNYFILNRLAVELNNELDGFVLNDAFSQEKEKLILSFNKNGKTQFIEISVNPGLPFLILRDSFKRAKKNSIGFFQKFLPAKIQSISISNNDRLIRFLFKNFSIYFFIRGKFTNVCLTESGRNYEFFKKADDEFSEKFSIELSQHVFTDFYNSITLDKLREYEDEESLRKDFPIIGKEIILECKTIVDQIDGKIIFNLIKLIEKDSLGVYHDESTREVILKPVSFLRPAEALVKEFDSVNEGIKFFISKKLALENYYSDRKLAEKNIEKELDRLSNKISKLETLIQRGSKEDLYNKLGNLLLINLQHENHPKDKIVVEDIYKNGIRIEIPIDKRFSLQKNADIYFQKARNEKVSFVKNQQLLAETITKYENFKKLSWKLNEANSKKALEEIMSVLKIKKHEQSYSREDLRNKFKHYLIEKQFHLFVGKDSQNNDLLTLKFAKQNDYWFHARSVSGSHAVLRIENSKAAVPKSVIKKAASIAAYHSKAKTSGMVPVSYTFKKYVIKRKGMEVGKVALLKEEVIIVKPEIPDDCEYITVE
ncbi:MAG: fibronectin/fibrinogen-binding protein [Ignavibacteriaceae bacterium]|nr:fibronectin/fibrinogen-binding protein [Ignavibacteriaceae bacterium]